MPRKIIVNDSEEDLAKFFDYLTYEQYKIFEDEIVTKLSDLFLNMAEAGKTGTSLLETSTLNRFQWASGEIVETSGKFPNQDDPKSWKIDSFSVITSDGTELKLTGTFVVTDGSALMPGTRITKVQLSSPTNLSSFFGTPTVIREMVSNGVYKYNGNGNFSGSYSHLTRLFEDGWKFDTEVVQTFNYIDGNYSDPTTRGVYVALTNASGLEVLKFDVSDYVGGEDSEAYDKAYIQRFFSGADMIAGTASDDYIASYAGNDTITSGTGNDTLIAGDGNDSVIAGDGADLIVGGDGAGNDSYDGGKGIDTVKYTSATDSIKVDLAKGTATSSAGGDAAGIGTDKLKGIENIIAGKYADTLTGSKDANVIEGDDGNDTLDGGLGNDTLIGGTGADRFVFSSKPAANNLDTITGFETGIDKIVFSKKIFAKFRDIADLTQHFATGAAADANDYLIYNATTGKLSYDADGNVAKSKAVVIALIGSGLDLTASDFVLV